VKGGKREGAGRKKNPDHLKRDLVTIRLPRWMLSQIRRERELGRLIEETLAKIKFLEVPDDYEVNK